jgi:hypothetical protein
MNSPRLAARAGRACAGLALAAAVLAACTPTVSAGHAVISSSTVGSTTPVVSTSDPAPTSTTPAPADTSSPARSSSVSARSSSSSVVPAVARCTASQLAVGVAKGGASLGQEIAVLSFTNTSQTPCTLSGYPTAILETSGGATLGKPAVRLAGNISLVLLAPTKSAQANLTADTRCNAAESSAVRVSAPGVPGATDVPVALRACGLHITPLA